LSFRYFLIEFFFVTVIINYNTLTFRAAPYSLRFYTIHPRVYYFVTCTFYHNLFAFYPSLRSRL